MDARVLIELAKDPKGYEKKLAELEAAIETNARSEAGANTAREAAAREREAADARIGQAEQAMAKVAKAMTTLERDNNDFVSRQSLWNMEKRNAEDDLKARKTVFERDQDALTRREVAVRAREEKVARAEEAVAKLEADYKTKLEGLKKLVA